MQPVRAQLPSSAVSGDSGTLSVWALVIAILAVGLLSICIYSRFLRGRQRATAAELETMKGRLESTQHQLIEREKMASLGQLTAGIAHEIKNPLNFVTNFSDLSRELIEELRTSETESEREEILTALQQNLTKISEHGHRADDIVRSMMLHARGGSTEHEAVDLNALITESVHLAYHAMRAQQDGFNCTIELDLEESLPHPPIVRQDIARVLLNITQNAMQAVHQRQKAGDPGFVPLVWIRSEVHNDHILVHVRDNGPGIPAALKERIYEPFFTTKAAGRGTGLGLSIAFDIITKGHGGILRAEEAPGGGAEFVIELPLQRPLRGQ
ncbi:MAG: two-component sensor histidine kinase [Bacteroidetes bacterium]|nr:two-component sensor histidine kinase [Bacteroidota bacterium]